MTTDRFDQPLLEINGPRGEVDLFKLDANGNSLWSYSFEGNGRYPVPVVLSTNREGDSVLFSNSVNGSRLQPFAALVDAAGAVRWRLDPVEVAGRYWDPMTVAVDATGSATVVGFADEPVDLGGGLLGGTARHSFVFQLDAAGSHVWSLGLGGLIDLPELASFADGSVLLAGTLNGRVRFGVIELSSEQPAPFVAKLSPSGQVVFARLFATQQAAAIHDLTVAENGTSYVALAFSDALDLGTEVLHAPQARTRALIKLAPDGQSEWSQVLGANLIQVSLATSKADELVMAAGFRNTITLGNRELSGGEWSTFAAKLDASGRVTWLQQWQGSPEVSPDVAAQRCGGVFVGVSFRKEYDTGRELLMNMRPPPEIPIERYVTAGQTSAALLHFGASGR